MYNADDEKCKPSYLSYQPQKELKTDLPNLVIRFHTHRCIINRIMLRLEGQFIKIDQFNIFRQIAVCYCM